MIMQDDNVEEELEGEGDSGTFEVGDQVRHPKWGVGTVMVRIGTGENMKLVVAFQEEGQKKLLARKARLKKVH